MSEGLGLWAAGQELPAAAHAKIKNGGHMGKAWERGADILFSVWSRPQHYVAVQ